LYSECLAIQRQFDLPAQAVTLWLLGLNASSLGERSLALSNFRQCLALSQKQGDLWTTMRAYEGLAAFASEEGDYEAAQQYCEKGLAFAGQTEDRRAKGGLLLHWASAMWHQGQNTEAHSLFRRSLTLFLEYSDKFMLSIALMKYGVFLQAVGLTQRAARLLGAADSLYEADGRRLPAEADPRLSQEAFAAAFAEGRAMTMEHAVEYALAGLDGDAEPSGMPSSPRPVAPS